MTTRVMEPTEAKESNLATKKRDYLLPASIVFAALLVSLSLVYSAGKRVGSEKLTAGVVTAGLSPENVRPVSQDDHIWGNPEAPVKIIEFSDLECPFCKRFHPTMKRIVAESNGQVAWVYRHFPLESRHSKARMEAEASECAYELGGNKGFWDYVDRLFEITPSNDGLDPQALPTIAENVGLDQKKFTACLESGKTAERVSRDLEDAVNSGGRGTPYSIVLGKSGKKFIIPGALNYEQVKSVVNQALQ